MMLNIKNIGYEKVRVECNSLNIFEIHNKLMESEGWERISDIKAYGLFHFGKWAYYVDYQVSHREEEIEKMIEEYKKDHPGAIVLPIRHFQK